MTIKLYIYIKGLRKTLKFWGLEGAGTSCRVNWMVQTILGGVFGAGGESGKIGQGEKALIAVSM